MAGYRYIVFSIMLCPNIFVRSQCIWQLSQSIWRSTDWTPILSALGISEWCCPDDEIVPTCGRGRLPVRADICAIRLCCNVFVEMRREDASGHAVSRKHISATADNHLREAFWSADWSTASACASSGSRLSVGMRLTASTR
jgi:hypothetical protein